MGLEAFLNSVDESEEGVSEGEALAAYLGTTLLLSAFVFGR